MLAGNPSNKDGDILKRVQQTMLHHIPLVSQENSDCADRSTLAASK
jgi:hypothetical protein